MLVENTDLLVYKSVEMSDGPMNGGGLSANISSSGAANNMFSDAGDIERQAGSTKYKKVWWKVANAYNLAYNLAKIYLSHYTTGGDYITFFAGTETDTQATITGNERQYGAAPLTDNVSASATSLNITLENANELIFLDNDSFWIGDGQHEEFHSDIIVSKNGDIVSIVLKEGDQIANSYNTSNTVVSSVYPFGTVKTSVSDWLVTSVSGIYNIQASPIQLNNIGTIPQTWTLTFSNSSQFTCVGSTVGSVGVGTITADFAPINQRFLKNYFLLSFAGFAGTFAAKDTIIFKTHPAAIPIWFKRIIPPNTASCFNEFIHTLNGESE